MPILITQKSAIRQLTAITGLSVATVTAAVKGMPKVVDGKRAKVMERSVRQLIDQINDVREQSGPGKIKLSRRTRERLHLLA